MNAHLGAGVLAVALSFASVASAAPDDDGPMGPRDSPSSRSTPPTPATPPTSRSTAPVPEASAVASPPMAASSQGEGERRAAIAALERLTDASNDAELLLTLARLYEACAVESGDVRDVRLATLAYTRYAAERPGAAVAVWPAIARVKALPVRPQAGRLRGGTTPVHFVAYRGDDKYEVETQGQHCATPCTLQLKPGPTAIEARGGGAVATSVVVPHLPSQVRLRHDNSSPVVITGAVLIPLGVTVAASMWSLGLACNNFAGACLAFNFITWPVLGGTMLITGIGLLAAGMGQRVPLDANHLEILESRRQRRRVPSLRLTSLAVAPTSQGVAAGASFAF